MHFQDLYLQQSVVLLCFSINQFLTEIIIMSKVEDINIIEIYSAGGINIERQLKT